MPCPIARHSKIEAIYQLAHKDSFPNDLGIEDKARVIKKLEMFQEENFEGNMTTEEKTKQIELIQRKDVWTPRDLEVILECSESTINRMIRDGDLPGRKCRGQWRFYKEEIYSWLRGPKLRVNPITREVSHA